MKNIVSLAFSDWKNNFKGSYFGIFWSIINPVLNAVIITLVFTLGLRTRSISGDVPFHIWLICGLVPWYFINESWNMGTISVMQYSYLIKKVKFDVKLIPPIKVLSSFISHFIFVCILLMLFGKFQILMFQLIIYMFMSIVMISGLSYLSAGFVAYFKDMVKIMEVLLQALFWITPIIWDKSIVPSNLMILFKINPCFYVVEAYRNTIIYEIPFYKDENILVFLLYSIVLYIIGIKCYGKLSKHFADVL